MTTGPATLWRCCAPRAVAAGLAGRLRDRWWRVTAAIALAGLAGRLYVVLIARPTCSPGATATGCFRINGDVLYHFLQARLIGDGHFFKNGVEHAATGRLVESAGDPPLFALLLGLWSRLGFDTVTWQRFLICFVGTATVVLIAVLARRVGSDRAGWAAGALAALHPLLWINDAMLMSESLYQPAIVVVILAAYAYCDHPSRRAAASLGALIATAALVRGEAALLVALLLAPLVWLARGATRGERARRLLIGGLAALAVVAPWLVYNNLRFSEPVGLTAATGSVLMAGSCDTAWSGPDTGSWWDCFSERDLWGEFEAEFPGITAQPRALYDESRTDAFNQRKALAYIGDNLGRYPIVMAARVGRALDLFAVGNSLHRNWVLEGRWKRPSQAGLALYYLLIVPAGVGAVRLRRAGRRLTPLLAQWPLVIATAALTFGLTRYRVPVDIALIVLAAVGLAGARPAAATATADGSDEAAPPR